MVPEIHWTYVTQMGLFTSGMDHILMQTQTYRKKIKIYKNKPFFNVGLPKEDIFFDHYLWSISVTHITNFSLPSYLWHLLRQGNITVHGYLQRVHNCRNNFYHMNVPKRDSKPGSSEATLLEFERRLKPLGHHGRLNSRLKLIS